MVRRERRPGAEEDQVVPEEHATYHATPHATLLAWPILTILAFRRTDDPLFTLCVIGLAAMFAFYLWGMLKVEHQLNDEGQSLFYPWRVPSPRRKGLRVDDALRNALHGLANCDMTEVIAWRLDLRTKGGKLVPEAARGSYDKAVARLENSRGLERSEELRVLREAEKWLWAARAEVLREMVR